MSWEWGAARADRYAVLYGRVQPPDSVAASQPLFVYLVDSLGFRALFRPREITYDDARTIAVSGTAVRIPAHGDMFDARGDDTLHISIDVEDATVTDTRRPLVERGDYMNARRIARPFFVQMKGTVRLEGRVQGHPINARGAGFFETYR